MSVRCVSSILNPLVFNALKADSICRKGNPYSNNMNSIDLIRLSIIAAFAVKQQS